jgi:hypothetical protein
MCPSAPSIQLHNQLALFEFTAPLRSLSTINGTLCKFLPRHPAFGTMETPIPYFTACDNQSPAWLFAPLDLMVLVHIVVRYKLYPMGMGGPAERYWMTSKRKELLERSYSDRSRTVRQVLDIGTLEHDRNEPPRVVVECSVVFATQKFVDIDIEKGIAGHNKPPQQVGVFCPTDHEMRLTSQPFTQPVLI